jgi:hypothetical protein
LRHFSRISSAIFVACLDGALRLLRRGAIIGGAFAASSSRRRLGDLTEAAANLFAFLHDLDATGAETIAVAPPPLRRLSTGCNAPPGRAKAKQA